MIERKIKQIVFILKCCKNRLSRFLKRKINNLKQNFTNILVMKKYIFIGMFVEFCYQRLKYTFGTKC